MGNTSCPRSHTHLAPLSREATECVTQLPPLRPSHCPWPYTTSIRGGPRSFIIGKYGDIYTYKYIYIKGKRLYLFSTSRNSPPAARKLGWSHVSHECARYPGRVYHAEKSCDTCIRIALTWVACCGHGVNLACSTLSRLRHRML